MVRGTRRRADCVVYEHCVQRKWWPRAAGYRLCERIAAAQGNSGRLRKLLASNQPKRTEHAADHGGRHGGATRTQTAHSQRQLSANQPARLREHVAWRVRRLHSKIRQRRFGSQRTGSLSVSLRDGCPAASRRPIRPTANVQGISGRVRRARRYATRVLPDADPVPAHRRSGR